MTKVETFPDTKIIYLPISFECIVKDIAFVRFGSDIIPVTVKQGNTDVLQISSTLYDELGLPGVESVQLRIEDDILVIGPFVGMLIDNPKHWNVVLTRISKQLHKLGGVVVYFDADDLDITNKTCLGYVYTKNTETNKLELSMETLPLPDVVFKRGAVSDKQLSKLQNYYGENLLNSNQHDKHQIYNLLVQNNDLKHHLPKTSKLNSDDDLRRYLIDFGRAIVKPTNGKRGIGIKLFVHSLSRVVVHSKTEAKNSLSLNRFTFSDYVQQLISERDYIVSSYINSLKIYNRKVDFRVIVQKQPCGAWKVMSIIPYTGKQGGISGNDQNEGYYIKMSDIFEILSIQSKTYQQKIIKRLNNLALETAKQLDRQNCNYVDLGLDIILDVRHNAWLVEVNKYHNHRLPLYIDDKETYNQIKLTPLKLAITKSGFEI